MSSDGPKSWNYRVVNALIPDGLGEFDDRYWLIEAYYDDAGNIVAWCDAVPPQGSTREELERDVRLILDVVVKSALSHHDNSVLDATKLPGYVGVNPLQEHR